LVPRTSFVIAYIEIYVFRGNLFQAHSLQQSYHLNRKNIIQNQKYKCENNKKLIYLTFIHCTNKFEKPKKLFLNENHEQTFHNKNHKKLHRGGRRGVIVPTHLE